MVILSDFGLVWFLVFNATFSNISAISWKSKANYMSKQDSQNLCKLQKGCTRLAAASDKVDQLLAHGRWFSPGTPASSNGYLIRFWLGLVFGV
jgi:hypothetical protein